MMATAVSTKATSPVPETHVRDNDCLRSRRV